MAKKKNSKNIEKQAEEFVKKELPKAQKKVDKSMGELENYIREEPLQAVTAAFIIGVFVGKVMK
jgi:ElaB/YqjD/DUF883 family membrane-anchored ribosome-binding protein